MDFNQNNIQFQKLLDFFYNDFLNFEKNNKCNVYEIDNNISCYKIIDDICEKKKDLNVYILEKKKFRNKKRKKNKY